MVLGVHGSSSQGVLLAYYANNTLFATNKASFALRILSRFEVVATQKLKEPNNVMASNPSRPKGASSCLS